MRELTFTYFRSKKDIKSKKKTMTWDDWIGIFTRHEVRGVPSDASRKQRLEEKKDGPAVILGELNGSRSKENVVAAHAIALDIDSISEPELLESMGRLGQFEYVVYTTHRHGSTSARGKPRVRVVLPFLEPVTPEVYPEVWEGLNRLVGGINDPQTKDISRLHFLPSTFDPEVAEAMHHPGKWLAPDDLPTPERTREKTATLDDFNRQKLLVNIKNRAKVIGKDDPLKPAAMALTRGQPFADPGSRHNTVLQLTMWLERMEDDFDSTTLEMLFGPSLEVMESISPGAPTIDEVVSAYQGAVEKSEKHRLEQQARQASEHLKPYTDADLERIAKRQGWTPDQLHDRWAVQRDGAAWLLTSAGDYVGPFSKDDLGLAASRVLAAAPIRLIEFTQNGFRFRPIADVVREVGSLAMEIISDMTIQYSTFNAETETMHDAVSPLRTDLKPTFNQEIDQWLHLLGGPLYIKLVDWLSCCSDLTKLLCAIYFDGPEGSGKTLFAHGVAKLWTEGGPAEIEKVLSDFNDELVRSPVIIADEEIPMRWGRQTVTTTLRSMLSTTQRTLKRKYRPNSDLKGAIRLVLTANNAFLLESSGVSSAQDLNAIARRFLYVPVGQAATDYLNTLSRETKEHWMERGIAEHALYLSEHHEIKEVGKRFWVEGDVSQMHRMLMTGTRWNSFVCEWLVKYLMNPQPFDVLGTGLIRRQKGELLVNDQALVDKWELYMSARIDPETAKIGSALRAIASTKDRKQLRWQGKQIRYRVIDLDHLVDWSDRYNIGDSATMRAQLTPPEVEPDGNVLNVKFQSPEQTAGTDEEGNVEY